jgi:putative spermidine/putrescine transport system substrate-binding protein
MKQHTSRPRLLAGPLGVVMAFGIWIGAASPGFGEELNVVAFGGTFGNAWNRVVIKPFEAEQKADVRTVTGLSADVLAKLRAQRNDPQIDVVMFNVDVATIAANEGLLDRLDPQQIPVLNDIIETLRTKDDLYANFLSEYQTLAYNTQYVKQAPTSWKDLWKPEYKGKISLPDVGIGNWSYFIATTGKVFGKGFYDSDTAFREIKALRASVLTLYTSHDQLAQLLNQGEVWLAPWGSDRAIAQQRAGAPIASGIPSEGTVLWALSIGVSKGSKHKALAEKYISRVLSPAVQKELAEAVFLAPTNRQVQLPPDLARQIGMASAVPLDWGELNRLRDSWAERWSREVR